MDRIYSAFVSSTYSDLIKEREAAMNALLELGCLPIGMERFPAASESAFAIIKKKIDICDFYVLLLGGRYGSMLNENISYTEAEYRYAVETKKRILAFVHADPESIAARHVDGDPFKQAKLRQFRESLSVHYKKFNSAEDLARHISIAISEEIRSSPKGGWHRAGAIQARQFLSMLDCFEDAVSRAQSASNSNTLTLDLIALDLASGADYIKYWLDQAKKVKDFRMRVLAVTHEPAEMVPDPSRLPQSVSHWCASVNESLKFIQSSMKAHDVSTRNAGRSFHSLIKKYRNFPTIHGWSLSSPFRWHYVSFCWWDGADYDWGQQNYLSIGPEDTDEVLRHFATAHDAAFKKLWAESGSLVLDTHCGTWPKSPDFTEWLEAEGGCTPPRQV